VQNASDEPFATKKKIRRVAYLPVVADEQEDICVGFLLPGDRLGVVDEELTGTSGRTCVHCQINQRVA
jgi:hypothetical protein